MGYGRRMAQLPSCLPTDVLNRISSRPLPLQPTSLTEDDQSVVFETKSILAELESFRSCNGVEHLVTVAGISPIMPNRAERLPLASEVTETMAVAGSTEV